MATACLECGVAVERGTAEHTKCGAKGQICCACGAQQNETVSVKHAQQNETVSVKMCSDDWIDEVYYNGQDIRNTVSNVSRGADGLKTFTFEAVPDGVLAIAANDNQPGSSAGFGLECTSTSPLSKWNLRLSPGDLCCRAYGTGGVSSGESGDRHVGAMKRPNQYNPPPDWYKNEFDDTQWEQTTKSTDDHWTGIHGLAPGVWYKKHKFTFYRVDPDPVFCTHCTDRATQAARLETDLEPLIQQSAFSEALSALKSALDAHALVPQYKVKMDKIAANILLASETVSAEDFIPLIANGTLDASPAADKKCNSIPEALCVQTVTAHASSALRDAHIQRLDLSSNKRLASLPLIELGSIDSLQELACRSCTALVPRKGGVDLAKLAEREAVLALRACKLEKDLEAPVLREEYDVALAMLKTWAASLSSEMRQRLKIKLNKIEANLLLASDLGTAEDFARLVGAGSETVSVKMCADDWIDEVYYNGQDIRNTVSNVSRGADGLKTFTFEAVPGGVLAIAANDNQPGSSAGFGLECTSTSPHSKWNLRLCPGQLECRAYGTGSSADTFRCKTPSASLQDGDTFRCKTPGCSFQRNMNPSYKRAKAERWHDYCCEACGRTGSSRHGGWCQKIPASASIGVADGPPMTLVPRGSADRCVFTHAADLQKGNTSTLALLSHPGRGIGKKHCDERRAGPWRYIESGGCAEWASIRVRYEDGNYIKLADDDLVLDVASWKMEAGSTVNFVGGTTEREMTKQGGGGRDWTINDDGTISAKHHPHLVLGIAQQGTGTRFKLRLAGGRGLALEHEDVDATHGHRAHFLRMASSSEAIEVEFTEKNSIKVVAGHHSVGYALDNWYAKKKVGNRLHFSNWPETNASHQWQVNEDGTLSPAGARHLVLGWVNHALLVKQGDAAQLCFVEIQVDGSLKRPEQYSPPSGWYETDFDDSQWKPPTEATNDHWPNHHGLSPGVWCKGHKYTFYRIKPVQKRTLNASPASEDSLHSIPVSLCAKKVTKHAAGMLLSSGIECLDLRCNQRLALLPAAELCDIDSLRRLECAGCPLLASPPIEVAGSGGVEAMDFLRECVKNGSMNECLALFLLGAGESGKTSLVKALMNEGANVAAKIGKDTRTVGMDVLTWQTTDNDGNPLYFKIGDVGGQRVYLKLHELFVLDRALYVYAWRPKEGVGAGMQEKCEDVITWLNLLQSRVPGVSVVPVVTHIDCVSSSTLVQQCAVIRDAFQMWEARQNLTKSDDFPVVRVLNGGESFQVNCLGGDGIDQLRSALLSEAAHTKGYHEPLPTTWLDLRGKVREMSASEKFVTWEEFTQLACQQCQIPKTMLLSVTSFLHETLELRFFGLALMRRRKEIFEDFLTVVLGSQRTDGNVEGDARALFDQIDTNGSGAIDATELRDFLQKAGLEDANVEMMLLSAGHNSSHMIEFAEFRELFADAKAAAKDSRVSSSIVYLNIDWMVDIMKGIVRHDHTALHAYLQDERKKELILHARRLRVQGIIHRALLDFDLLWPGLPSPFWERVTADETEHFKYEKGLWDDGHGALKKVVASDEDKAVAIGLLEGFKVILAGGADSSEYLCPDLIPPHKRDATDGRSLDASACEYFLAHTYSEIPSGFWVALFMEIRSNCTSGTHSTHIQAFFVLSAQIQVKKIEVADGNTRIEVKASTSVAFKVATTALDKVLKFYIGMASWQVSREEMSAEDRARIIEPAQVLVVTAASMLQKNADAITTFNDAVDRVSSILDPIKQRLSAETAAMEEKFEVAIKKPPTREFEQSLAHLEGLKSRLGCANAHHFTGSTLLPEVSKDLEGFVEHVIRADYHRCMRKEKRLASDSERPAMTAKKNQVVDASTAVAAEITPCLNQGAAKTLDRALFSALSRGKRDEAQTLLGQGADPFYESPTCCYVPYTPRTATPSPRRKAVIRLLCLIAVFSVAVSMLVLSGNQPWGPAGDLVADKGQSLGRLDDFRRDDIIIRVNTSIPSQPGCLFEAGGMGRGTFIGTVEVSESESLFFRFTAGDGGDVGDASDDNTAVLMIPLPDARIPQDGKAHQLILTISVQEHRIQLIIDGTLVAAAKSNGAFSNREWSGGDEACVGRGCSGIAKGGDPSPWLGEFQGQMQFWKSSGPFESFVDHKGDDELLFGCNSEYPGQLKRAGFILMLIACGCTLFFKRVQTDHGCRLLTVQICCNYFVMPLVYFGAIPILMALMTSSPECGGRLWWMGCFFLCGIGLAVLLSLGSMLFKSSCYGTQSSVAEANKSAALSDLLHSYGCDDPNLKISQTAKQQMQAGKRLKNCMEMIEELHQSALEPFSQPRSMLPTNYMLAMAERVEGNLSSDPDKDTTETDFPTTVNTQGDDNAAATTDTAWTHAYSKISAEEIQGCWAHVCFPGFSCIEKKVAQGPDTLIHQGICCPLLLAYTEQWDRVAGTNTFQKRKDKEDKRTYTRADVVYEQCLSGFGLGCECRLCKLGGGYSQPNGGPREDQFFCMPCVTALCCWSGQAVLCPMHFLAMLGCSSGIRCLARKGCGCFDPNMQHPLLLRSTPLHDAAHWGHLHAVMELIDKGADPSLVNDAGDTALTNAWRERHEHVARYLEQLQNEKRRQDSEPQTSTEGTLEQVQREQKRRGSYATRDGILADAAPTDAMEFIETLFPALDKHFERFHGVSKEVYSPHSVFTGRARVVLVLCDEAIGGSAQVCARFRELEGQGCSIIGIPMPGYKIENYAEWWPESMPEFKDHSLFFDGRWKEQWGANIRQQLMPQIQKFLQESNSNGAVSTMSKQGRPRVANHHLKISIDIEENGEESFAEMPSDRGLVAHHLGEDPQAPVSQPYASKEEMRECILPCPSCLQLGKSNPGGFERDLCMLSFYSVSQDASTNVKGMLFCLTCNTKVKNTDVLKRKIFLSYNWGKDLSTQKIAKRLCENLFLATEMPYWLDIDGGMGVGEELVTEMRDGIAECEIVILMISDAFCNSGNCLREFIHTCNTRKYVIPVLVPDRGDTRTGPSGWTGQYAPGDQDWWRHAESICKTKDPDAPEKKIQWSYLAGFSPIDIRHEKLEEDGALPDNSDPEIEMIRRIMSRFFREQKASDR